MVTSDQKTFGVALRRYCWRNRERNKFIRVHEVQRNENVFSVYRSRKRREVKGAEDGKGRIYTQSCRIYQDTEPFVKRVCRL
jgi:hypothetical protein